jgi:PKD repeat protein
LRNRLLYPLLAWSLVTCGRDRSAALPSEPAVASPDISAAAVAAGPVVLVGAGNIARCDRTADEATALLLDSIPGTVFAAGDNAWDKGRLLQYQTCYGPNWGRHKARTRPTPGDRDYKTSGASGYFSYFGAAAGDPTTGYYSYDLGAWHVVVLNSELSLAAGSTQELWLRSDLAANPRLCTAAYFHKPLFSSKTGPNTSLHAAWEALYAAGVELVVNAHYGFYERFAPQTPAGTADAAFGIREFIAGTGGAEVTAFGTVSPNSEVRNSGTAGVLRLVLDTAAYTWEFVPVTGKTFRDSGTGNCHGPPPPPPPPPASVTLVGAGDIADCAKTQDELTAQLLDTIPGTVITLGDNAYPHGALADYTNCYAPTWGRHKARTKPIPGNHEYETPGASGYFSYFGAAAGDPAKGYYSYDLGDWHIVALNGYVAHAAGSTQEQWLRADLGASTKRCTLAYWHGPLFSSGSLTDTTMRPLWQALYDDGAEVVLAGHEHHYERFAPQTAAGAADPAYGIRQIVVGTGGSGLFGFGTVAPNSEVRNAATFGVLRVTLRPDGYDWKFIPIQGQTFTDQGSGTCHDAPTGGTNRAPTAAAGGPYSGTTGTPVVFDGSASFDPDGDPLSYAWTFGDGGTGSGVQPSHVYQAAGSYSATLRVTDSRGASSATVTAAVMIASPGQGAVTLVGAGNIARCDRTNDEATAAILDTIPGTVIVLGDNVYPAGTATNFGNCYDPSWGRHKARTRPVIGNREYDSSATAADYFSYFGAAAGDPGKGYYSFDAGAWHVVVLNSNNAFVPTGVGSAQETWLRSDLAATTKTCVIALFHHPRFYSTTSTSFSPTSSVKAFWDALYAAGAELIVNAHMRDYERFAPQDPAGAATPNGIREFVAGTGGEGFDAPHTLIIPNSEARISQVPGVLRLTLGDGTYAWQFIAAAGMSATDSGSGTCH